MKRRDLTVRAGDVLPASRWHVYGAPFGVLSLAVLGLWFFVLTIPIMGWLNKRELMLTQIAGWDGTTWSAIVGVPVAILALQVLLRLWLHYHSETRVGKISGWLISSRALEALGNYIVARNRVLQATMEGELH